MDYRFAKIEGDTITLTKSDLEELRDHYCNVADKEKRKYKKGIDMVYGYYLGKADVFVDMLKMFEPYAEEDV